VSKTLEKTAAMTDTRDMESVNTNGRNTMSRSFYVQITGDGNGKLSLFDYPLAFGPYASSDIAAATARSLRAYGYDAKVAPIATMRDAQDFLDRAATAAANAVEPMGRAQ